MSFLSVPVDADALNAVLRLCLRFTQDFRYAVEFAKLGGIKYILNLTQASTFNGFSSIVALLIRHVMEDPATLRLTLEKVVRGSTVQSNQYSTKELHYLLRMLAPAACRAPQMFAEVAGQILRVDIGMIKRGDEEDPKLFIKSLPPVATASSGSGPSSKPPTSSVHNPALGTEPSVLTPDHQQQQEEHEDLSKSVITDLLNFLVIDSCPVPPVQSKFSFFKVKIFRKEIFIFP